jgi:hypothetical protein
MQDFEFRSKIIRYDQKNLGWICSLISVLLAGCAAHEAAPELAKPAVDSHLEYYVGTPLSGPQVGNPTASAKQAMSVRVTFIALEKMPPTVFEGLDSQVRLILAMRQGTPVLPSGKLTYGARFTMLQHSAPFEKDFKSAEFGRNTLITTQSGVLLPEATIAFSVEGKKMEPDVLPEEPARQRLELAIYRSPTPANPSRQDAANLSFQFRQKKFDLLEARARASQEAEAQLASGSTASDAVTRLRNIDQALAATEDALDQLYDLQQPGAEKQAARRTRAACLQIGQQRLDAVRDVLLEAGISNADQQIKLTHAAFKQADGSSGGTVTIVLSRMKKE